MLQAPTKSGHSAVVQMTLEYADTFIQIWQAGPDEIIAKAPMELPPCEAVLVVSVDGNVRRTRVRLPQGMSPTDEVTPIELLAP
jgi:hypothetical protein